MLQSTSPILSGLAKKTEVIGKSAVKGIKSNLKKAYSGLGGSTNNILTGGASC